MTTSDDNSSSDNLRSRIEERERVERVAEKEQQAKVSREKEAEAVAKARVEAERAEAERAEARRAEEAERTEVERAETARAKAANEEKKKAQKLAIQKLESKKEMTVPLIDSEPTPDLSPYPTSKAIELCDDFDIDNLISPSLELASPYNAEDQLRIDGRSDSRSRVPTWTIKGSIFQKSNGTRTPDIAGSIVAREGKLFLELAREGPMHALFPRLENSILIISTGAPEDTRNLTNRREIKLAQPIEAPSPYLLDPLSKNDQQSIPIEASIVKRIEDIITAWRVELKHPAFDESVILTAKDTPKDFPLIKPATGLELRYHTIDAKGEFQVCVERMRYELTVEFNANRFELRPRLLGLTKVLNNVVTIDRLRMLRDNRDPQSREVLETKVANALGNEQRDPVMEDLRRTYARLAFELQSISRPGADPITAPHNDEYRAKYEKMRARKEDEMRDAAEKVSKREAELRSTVSKDAEDLVKAIADAADKLQPIEAQIKEVTATAVSASGTCSIPIIVCSADPVQD